MRLLLIEDDQKVANFVVSGLAEAGYDVVHEDRGDSGFEQALAQPFDLLIVDLMLPGKNGLQVIEELRAGKVRTPMLVLSALGTVEDRVRGLRGGADDYLVKPFAFSELVARVQAPLRRSPAKSDTNLLVVGDLELDLLKREARREGHPITLQTKEFELLEYLMRNAGMVVSKSMIMGNVWNYNFDPGTNIVEARMSCLRDKIDKPFATKMISNIRGAGYVLKA